MRKGADGPGKEGISIGDGLLSRHQVAFYLILIIN